MSNEQRSLRLWPGVVLVALLWLLWFVVPMLWPDIGMTSAIAGAACGAGVVLWWLLFSRAPVWERLGVLVVIALLMVATRPALHPSIAGGMMGRMFYVFSIPGLCLALVVWASLRPRFGTVGRWVSMAVAIALACAAWTLLRTDGVKGEGWPQLAWRWTKTHEEMLVAKAASIPAVAPPVSEPPPPVPAPKPVAEAKKAAPARAPEPAPAVWPGFRGPNRDGRVRGVKIRTDWASAPPAEMWRRPIGPGWSSFAVRGDMLYTQEQLGEEEIVACYRLSTGQPVWRHADAARFYESNGGPGPRATPALSGDRIYTLGATGILNVLNADTGAVVWSRNAATETKTRVPGWGFAGSPLVLDGAVVVSVSGTLASYDADSGTLRWSAKTGAGSYSSPHLVTLGGASQILLLSGTGTNAYSSDGKKLWQNAWEGTPIVQPAMTADGDLLVTMANMMGGMGTRRLTVRQAGGGWSAEERWTSSGLKPYFNDFVVHKGHAYGFDGFILSCIDLADGNRKWKGGRFGHGQVLLLPDQDLLLVLSEEGELALVAATNEKFSEVARFQAIEGKTWNHPVLAGNVLVVRNGQEMAAFRLATAP